MARPIKSAVSKEGSSFSDTAAVSSTPPTDLRESKKARGARFWSRRSIWLTSGLLLAIASSLWFCVFEPPIPINKKASPWDLFWSPRETEPEAAVTPIDHSAQLLVLL